MTTSENMNTFEGGFFWNNYQSIESDFLRFLEYAPYHKSNLKMYSPKLTGFLLQIGGYVDSAFKGMVDYFNFRTYRKRKRVRKKEAIADIVDAFCLFEDVYNLSSNNGGHVIAKLDFGDKEMYPFKSFSSPQFISPEWWLAYNKVKHEYSLHYRKASLNNVLEALAGAFLLNVTHYPSIKVLWQLGCLATGVKAEDGFSEIYVPEKTFDEYLEIAVSNLQPLNIGIRAETDLFLYAHN